MDALLPPEMAVRAEEVGVVKAHLDMATIFVLAVLAGAFIALGAIFATTAMAGAASALPVGAVWFIYVDAAGQTGSGEPVLLRPLDGANRDPDTVQNSLVVAKLVEIEAEWSNLAMSRGGQSLRLFETSSGGDDSTGIALAEPRRSHPPDLAVPADDEDVSCLAHPLLQNGAGHVDLRHNSSA